MTTDFWEGAEIISVYTRADAIEDGTLVDVSEVAREAGFKYPVALTRTAWCELVEWDAEHGAHQDESGRLWDVLWMARHFIGAARDSSVVKCEVYRVPNTAKATQPRLAAFVAHCGPGDNAEPVITMMLPGED